MMDEEAHRRRSDYDLSRLSRRQAEIEREIAKITEDLQGIRRTVSFMRELLQRFDDLKPKRDGPRSLGFQVARSLLTGNSGNMSFLSVGKRDRYARDSFLESRAHPDLVLRRRLPRRIACAADL